MSSPLDKQTIDIVDLIRRNLQVQDIDVERVEYVSSENAIRIDYVAESEDLTDLFDQKEGAVSGSYYGVMDQYNWPDNINGATVFVFSPGESYTDRTGAVRWVLPNHIAKQIGDEKCHDKLLRQIAESAVLVSKDGTMTDLNIEDVGED